MLTAAPHKPDSFAVIVQSKQIGEIFGAAKLS
jgi:hypothetical protein